MGYTALMLPPACGDEPLKSTSAAPAFRIERNRDGETNGLVGDSVAVQKVLCLEGACGEFAKLGAHEAFGVGDQLFGEGVHFFEAVLGDDLLEAALTDTAGADLSSEVALALLRSAHVVEDQREDLGVHLASADETDRGDADAFLIDLATWPHGAGEGPADVRMMGSRRDIEGRGTGALNKDRKDKRDVGQVGAAGKGIIEDGDVAFLKIEIGNHRLHG